LCFVPLRSTSAQASIPLNSVYTIYFILPTGISIVECVSKNFQFGIRLKSTGNINKNVDYKSAIIISDALILSCLW